MGIPATTTAVPCKDNDALFATGCAADPVCSSVLSGSNATCAFGAKIQACAQTSVQGVCPLSCGICTTTTSTATSSTRTPSICEDKDDAFADECQADTDCQSSLTFCKKSGAVKAFSSAAIFINLKTTEDYIELIKENRRVTDNFAKEYYNADPDDLIVFTYSPLYDFFEQYLYIYELFGWSFGIATVLIAIEMLLLVPHPLATIAVVLASVMTVTDVFAFCWVWGIDFNGFTLANLILCLAMGVEYTAHIARAYVVHSGSPREKALKTAHQMALPVFNGAMSTFVGVLPLGLGQLQIYRIFYFRMFILMIGFGLVHGLLFVPALLFLMSPSSTGLEKAYACDVDEEGNEHPPKCIAVQNKSPVNKVDQNCKNHDEEIQDSPVIQNETLSSKTIEYV